MIMDKISFFAEKCKAHHLKVTPQRTAIFKILATAENHPSADEIFQEIQPKFPHISFDTVNRTLLTFAEIGIVDLAEGHGTPRRFDTNLVPHHHFFCIKCGRLTDFICKAYDNLEIPEKIRENFTITSKRVVLKGICDACRSLNKT
jgi:Fur family peroxide stress response transcriptional regulator